MQQITVSTLVRYLKTKLDSDNNLQKILVSGEISNFNRHFSGHIYFTLKDEYSAIDCVMFKTNAASLTFNPKTGDKVIVAASTSLYETTGRLQLYVNKINLDGLGELYIKYEALRKKLENNGIFDQDKKIELTKKYIENVAVLVGDKSAALSDIRTTFLRRWPLCNVDYFPVLVQGTEAPKQIIDKLKEVDKRNYDAIILARGGGSFEDLFCFNDEQLVMTIYKLKTFIITGIGHEQDFTLADFVADKRAATPTASVELITPNINDVISDINEYEDKISNCLLKIYNNKKMNYDYHFDKLLHFQSKLNLMKEKIDNSIKDIVYIINTKLDNCKTTYKRYITLLEAYSVQNTLKRGYTLVFQDNKLIKKKKDLKNKEFSIRFSDGEMKAKGM